MILSTYLLRTGRALKVAVVAAAFSMFASCVQIEKVDDSDSRTILVYMAADNNLTSNANPNIYSMNSSIRSGMGNDNLLVFVDRRDVEPALLHIHDNKIDTIFRYGKRDSTDPRVLREVIDYVAENWKSDSYGLVLWSHGTGWLPTSQLHFVAPNMNYVQGRDGNTPTGQSVLDIQRYSRQATKAFAWENRSWQRPAYSCMEIQDLADAIPDGMFDFIAFDACYMGNIEVVYPLRKKARYIISSCYEILSYGYPYHIVTRDLMNGNLIKVCREFHSYYNKMSGWERMAGISLVKTEGLDSLADCFSKIVAGKREMIADMDVSDIQHFDRFTHNVFYDLEDFVEHVDASGEYLKEFKEQLDRTVLFKISTPYIFPGDVDEIKIDKYCGLSVYIPVRDYEAPGLNEDYRETEWSIDTGY